MSITVLKELSIQNIYFLEKKSSAVITSPKSKSKFKMFPTPRKRKNAKKVRDAAIIKPLLEFSNSIAVVKKSAKNIKKKNEGIAPKASGSIK